MCIKSLVVAAAIILLPWQGMAQEICFPDLQPWEPVVVNKQQYAAWLRRPMVRRKLLRKPGQFPLLALTQSGFNVPFEGVCNATCAQDGGDDEDLRTIRRACRAVYKGEYCFKWFIPTNREFEWTGRFVVKSLGVETKLTIRGKEQNGSFDILMQQGCASNEDPVCVKNLVKDNKFYTVTREWQKIEGINTDFPLRKCFFSSNSVTVDDLNFLLASARFVGTEKVDRKIMDHFRATCIGRTVVNTNDIPDIPWHFHIPRDFPGLNICQSLSVFSDLYVARGRGNRVSTRAPFSRWFQYGDGVGLDPQQDEWFIIDKESSRAGPIELPGECQPGSGSAIPVLQQPCKNLIYLQ